MDRFKKFPLFYFFNFLSVGLLCIWLYIRCIDIHTGYTAIVLDMIVLILCFSALFRVSDAIRGKFKPFQMVSLYYGSIFFLFSWLIRLVSLIYDAYFLKKSNTTEIGIAGFVFITLIINFYISEKINIENIEKIESGDNGDGLSD